MRITRITAPIINNCVINLDFISVLTVSKFANNSFSPIVNTLLKNYPSINPLKFNKLMEKIVFLSLAL